MIADRLGDIPGVDKVCARPIPEGLICKDLMTDGEGNALYSYEQWVLELINASTAFMSKTGGSQFVAPVSEAHGEDDAITPSYSVDFKLILGQSMQQALRECSSQLVVQDGVTFACTSRSHHDMDAALLHTVLRDYDVAGLDAVARGPRPIDKAERDVWSFLRSISHDKHLLLVCPYLFYSTDGDPMPRDVISQCLHRDFGNAMRLRKDWFPDKDTYIACFHRGAMLVDEFASGRLVPFDTVPVQKSPTFIDVADKYSPIGYSLLGELLGESRGQSH